MLLIDGKKYNEWVDLREVEDLEPMIQEQAKDIFGENALYIDRKQKLRSLAGTGSIPDAYVISLGGDSPHWHIVEIELSYKDPGRHLVTQLNDFINGMKNSRNEIVSAINQWIKSDGTRTLEFKRNSQCGDIHEFLSDLIKEDPILTIIIEKNTPKLKEAIQIFEERYRTEIIEFRTFRREEAEAVHAHLFDEPPYKLVVVSSAHPVIVNSTTPPEPPTSNGDKLEVVIRSPYSIGHWFYIPKGKRSFFPGYKIPFTLETDISEVETHMTSAKQGTQVGDPSAGQLVQGNLAEWYRQHPAIKVGDKLRFTVIEPMKKYRLDIVK